MTSSDLPRAVVFDLDGTLVDSVADLREALNFVLEGRGLRPHSLAEVRDMVGGGIPTLLARAYRAQGRELDADEAGPLARRFIAYYAPRATARTRFYPGAVELIEALAKAGVGLGVCTNKPQDITLAVLRDLGVLDRFGAVVGVTDDLPRKPDPAMLVDALKSLEVSPASAVMIGDSEVDVATARAAGVPVVVVAHGYSKRPASDLGADRAIASLSEAMAALRAIAAAAVPRM